MRQNERLFNALPYELQNLMKVETDMFKKHLDDWLRTMPDTPKIDGYGASVPAISDSIVDQWVSPHLDLLLSRPERYKCTFRWSALNLDHRGAADRRYILSPRSATKLRVPEFRNHRVTASIPST